MKSTFLIILFLPCFFLHAQSVEILPIGTKLHGYMSIPFVGSNEGNLIVQKEDYIQGKVCKKLFFDTGLSSSQWIYQSGDSIFGTKSPIQPWLFLFKNNFELGEQSSFGIPMGNYAFEVTAIDTLILGNTSIRRFTINSGYYYYRYIYDKLGAESGFLHWCGIPCDITSFHICGFEDNTQTYQPIPESLCDLVSTQSAGQPDPVFMAPNPGSNTMTVQITDQTVVPTTLRLWDLQGKIQISVQLFDSNPVNLDTESLAPGVYWIQVGTSAKKWVKL